MSLDFVQNAEWFFRVAGVSGSLASSPLPAPVFPKLKSQGIFLVSMCRARSCLECFSDRKCLIIQDSGKVSLCRDAFLTIPFTMATWSSWRQQLLSILRRALPVTSPFFLFFSFWLHNVARGILVPRPGIEPGSPEVEARSPNHWTACEVPILSYLVITCLLPLFMSAPGTGTKFAVHAVCPEPRKEPGTQQAFQHHKPSGKCKSEPWWDGTTCPLGQLHSKR